MPSLIDLIRARQSALVFHHEPREHRPEMLYFGCVDARLDPIADIGIDKGRAIIFRNIAAMIVKDANSAGAVLEFFLTHIPSPPPGQVKQIVVSGHTDCGGLKACLQNPAESDRHLPSYLEQLRRVRDRVLRDAPAGWDDARILREMEMESVRQSLANLLSYPVVRRSLDLGQVEIHGWILDTHSGRISEMDPATREFLPMSSGSRP